LVGFRLPRDAAALLGGEPMAPDSWLEALTNLAGQDLNPGLVFQRWLPLQGWKEVRQGGQLIERTEEFGQEMMGECLKSLDNLRADRRLLEAIHRRYDPQEWKELRMRQISPLTSRLGEHHPYENGFMFHPLYGIPYLPGSGIKGVVRDCLPEDVRQKVFPADPERPEQEVRSLLTVADAFPDSGNGRLIEVDVLTCHYPKYYTEGHKPSDDQNPRPVRFLVVPKDTVWVFRWRLHPALKDLQEPIEKAFRCALVQHGLGAKTASGYGLFEEDKQSHSGGSP
jgi:CRISPR/Cas system CMR subunit Cmr6 (Cas7 group RAMP superfamily)